MGTCQGAANAFKPNIFGLTAREMHLYSVVRKGQLTQIFLTLESRNLLCLDLILLFFKCHSNLQYFVIFPSCPLSFFIFILLGPVELSEDLKLQDKLQPVPASVSTTLNKHTHKASQKN